MATHVLHAAKFHFQTSDNNIEGVAVACRSALVTTVATSTTASALAIIIIIIRGRDWRRGVSPLKRKHMTTMQRFGISAGNRRCGESFSSFSQQVFEPGLNRQPGNRAD